MVSTRRSTLPLNQAPSSELDENESDNLSDDGRGDSGDNGDDETNNIVGMMNDVAKMQVSPRKRGRPPRSTDSSPNKRRLVATPNVAIKAVPGAGASAGGLSLQKRNQDSTTSRRSVNRRDIYAMADEEDHEPILAVAAASSFALPPPKKIRQLRQTKRTNRSPFKGKGILDIRNTGEVNLEDTPATKSTIQRNRVDPHANPLKLLPAVHEHNTRASDAHNLVKKPGLGSNNKDKTLTGSSEVYGTPGPADKAGVTSLATSTGTPKATSTLDETNTVRPRATPQRRTPRKPQTQVPLPGEAHDKASAVAPAPKPSAISKTQKPRKDARHSAKPASAPQDAPRTTTSQPNATQRSGATTDDQDKNPDDMTKRMQRRFEKLKRDDGVIVQAANLDGVLDVWQDMLEKATSIYKEREFYNHQHTQTEDLVALVDSQDQLYRKTKIIRLDSGLDADMQSLLTTTNELDRCIGFIHHQGLKEVAKPTQTSSQATSSNSNVDQAFLMDLYEHAIPALVLTLKTLLVTRYDEDENVITLGGYNELSRELSIIGKALRRAQGVKPRPKSVNSMLKNSSLIYSRIKTLRDVYNKKVNLLERRSRQNGCQEQESHHTQTMHEEINAEEIQARLRAENERIYEQRIQQRNKSIDRVRKHLEMIMQNGRFRYHSNRVHTTTAAMSQLEPIVDIDDLQQDSDDADAWFGVVSRGSPELGMDYTTTIDEEGEDEAQAQREHTEDIPGPPHISWSDDETVALLNGLQQYIGEQRFENIWDTYGAAGEVLSSRDVHELVLQAKFLKESMLARLTYELDEGWDWLRTIPD